MLTTEDEELAALNPADADQARRFCDALGKRGYPIPELVMVAAVREVAGVEEW